MRKGGLKRIAEKAKHRPLVVAPMSPDRMPEINNCRPKEILHTDQPLPEVPHNMEESMRFLKLMQ
jgi:hypothetical protein